VAVCAEQLSTYLTDRSEWKSGNCPVCGNLPAIAMLDPDGRRSMFCSFCWHEWPMPRVYCPFCHSTDGKTLHYLYSEAEKALRVDCCETCRKYIKVVDAREAGRTVYPPLEQVASLHLDIKAREVGFDAGISLHLPID
jgi:FdhE protein